MKRFSYKWLIIGGIIAEFALLTLLIVMSSTITSAATFDDDSPDTSQVEEVSSQTQILDCDSSVIPKDEETEPPETDTDTDPTAAQTGDTGNNETEAETEPLETEPEITPPGLLPEGDAVDDSYFDDAVFLGDSVSLMLQYYTIAQRKENASFLGGAQFLTAGSFSYANALAAVTDDSVHPTYQGTKMKVEDAIALMGAKKIYIMLGMNQIANYNYDSTLADLQTLINLILEQTPDAEFYFESVTPRMEDAQKKSLNNDIIYGYNDKLLEYCEENGYYYLDIASIVSDENGYLKSEYCSDPVTASPSGMGIHFTYAACAAWVNYLYTHTAVTE